MMYPPQFKMRVKFWSYLKKGRGPLGKFDRWKWKISTPHPRTDASTAQDLCTLCEVMAALIAQACQLIGLY